MYQVQYTKHLTKKKKVWCDGTLRQTGRKCILYDDEKAVIDTAWLSKNDVGVGKECKTDKFLISFTDLLPESTAEDSTPSSLAKIEQQPMPRSVATPQNSGVAANPLRRTNKLGKPKSLGARHTIRKNPPTKRPLTERKPLPAPPEPNIQPRASKSNPTEIPHAQVRESDRVHAQYPPVTNNTYPRHSNPNKSQDTVEKLSPAPPGGRTLDKIIAHLEESL